jgi:cell division protein FtsX
MTILDGISIRLEFTQNSSMLLIQRNLNATFILLLFSLLGTVFGLLGTVRSVMIVVELRADSIRKKIEKTKKFKKMIGAAKNIEFSCAIEEEEQQSFTVSVGHITTPQKPDFDKLITGHK